MIPLKEVAIVAVYFAAKGIRTQILYGRMERLAENGLVESRT
jgi:hypothetical protein